MDMYGMLKNTITQGSYDLGKMVDTITEAWYPLGRISKEQRDELIAKAQGAADPGSNAPDVRQMIKTLIDKVDALTARLDALDGGAELPDPDDTEYPAWKQWDGISKDYMQGAIVTHNGKLWQSTFAGQNTWEPGTIGTETLWAEYTA